MTDSHSVLNKESGQRNNLTDSHSVFWECAQILCRNWNMSWSDSFEGKRLSATWKKRRFATTTQPSRPANDDDLKCNYRKVWLHDNLSTTHKHTQHCAHTRTHVPPWISHHTPTHTTQTKIDTDTDTDTDIDIDTDIDTFTRTHSHTHTHTTTQTCMSTLISHTTLTRTSTRLPHTAAQIYTHEQAYSQAYATTYTHPHSYEDTSTHTRTKLWDKKIPRQRDATKPKQTTYQTPTSTALSLANFPPTHNSEMDILTSTTHLPFNTQMRAENNVLKQSWRSKHNGQALLWGIVWGLLCQLPEGNPPPHWPGQYPSQKTGS